LGRLSSLGDLLEVLDGVEHLGAGRRRLLGAVGDHFLDHVGVGGHGPELVSSPRCETSLRASKLVAPTVAAVLCWAEQFADADLDAPHGRLRCSCMVLPCQVLGDGGHAVVDLPDET
jgi:hypothetical protein